MKRTTKIDAIMSVSKLRVAAYCRVSTASDEQKASLDTQKMHYETYIRSNPEWEYAGLYYDEGISGTSQNGRNGLLALISDCEKRKIDLVLTKSISRFARNTTDCIEITRKLLKFGVRILFEKENIDTGSMESELMLSILGSLAESESVSISENEKWSIRKRFENDTYVISVPPYGYKNENGRMVIVPEQAAVVKEIFADILSGKTSSQIAEKLNQRGIVTVRGGRWRAERITELIANEKYVGDALFQKTYTDSSFIRHRNHGVCNQYLITEHHEPIVSHEVFDRANEIIRLRRKGKCDTKKYQNRYGFSGKIICGKCGSVFKRRIHYTVSGSYTAWCCKNHLQNITACSMKYVADDSLKAAFLMIINKLIFGRKYVLTPLLRKLQKEGRNKRLKEYDDLISQNIESQQILLKLLSSGMLDGDFYTQESTGLKNEFDRLQKEKSLISAENREEKITELEKLIKFTGENSRIEEYSDSLFLEFVDHIKIVSRHEAEFHLKCGLVLTEELI